MNPTFYKLRRGRVVFGVFAGLADRFGLDANLLRFLFVLFSIFHFYGFVGLAIYCLCAFSMPYKEDIEREKYGLGPRKRKDAEVIKDDSPFF